MKDSCIAQSVSVLWDVIKQCIGTLCIFTNKQAWYSFISM